jgi:cellulose synthase/poly-beta-1,6-N-acetylglucosamine synthase-like glycosyltransferase
MNIFIVTCLSASLICYIGSLSYHMYYLQASVSLFEQTKSRFYQTEAALVYARAWYIKNRKTLINQKIHMPGIPAGGSLYITCLANNQQAVCEAHLISAKGPIIKHYCVIKHDPGTDNALITDWSVR